MERACAGIEREAYGDQTEAEVTNCIASVGKSQAVATNIGVVIQQGQREVN